MSYEEIADWLVGKGYILSRYTHLFASLPIKEWTPEELEVEVDKICSRVVSLDITNFPWNSTENEHKPIIRETILKFRDSKCRFEYRKERFYKVIDRTLWQSVYDEYLPGILFSLEQGAQIVLDADVMTRLNTQDARTSVLDALKLEPTESKQKLIDQLTAAWIDEGGKKEEEGEDDEKDNDDI